MAAPPPATPFEQAKAEFLAGLACQQAGRFEQAAAHYQASLRLLPGRASTLINLAATQLQLQRPRDALASADAALAAEPTAAEAWLHRATALAELGERPLALAAFDRVLAAQPTHAFAWSSRGSLLRELGRLGEAAQAFRQAALHGADPALQAYYLAAVDAPEPAPPQAPAAYVQGLFDSYSDDFEHHLVGTLRYQAPQRLVDGLRAAAPGERFAAALDLGCGTGLCGPLVRPLVDRLVGLDLSARMLERARSRGVYDQLEQADVAAFLAHTAACFDLVLAADVFIYIGDLAPVFAGLSRVMARGVFSFTVEPAPEGSEPVLQPSLRYAHSAAYLQRLAREHGFAWLAMTRGPVRQDQGGDVEGVYVHLRRERAGA